MGKYVVEVIRTVSVVKTFEVDAANYQEAIDKAEQEASNTEFSSIGNSEYESTIMEAPEDRGECPECGKKLIENEDGTKNCHCGWSE